MDYSLILKRSWDYMWRYKALWLFGTLLALTTVNGLYFFPGDTRYEISEDELSFRLSEDDTLTFPGESLKIEFDDREPTRVFVKDRGVWREVHDIWGVIPEDIPGELFAVFIFLIVELVVISVIATSIRYSSEAALIQMVNIAEKSGERLGIRQGLRLGWSRSAWRLFLIDLLVYLPVTLLFVLLFGLAFSPLALWTSGDTAAGVMGTVVSVGMLFVVITLAVLVGILLAPVLMIIRRACAVEQLGPIDAIKLGLRVARARPLDVFVTWLIWIGVRILATLATMPLLLLLIPLLLLTIIAGALLGALPMILVGLGASVFFTGPVPWIMGAMIALPIFVVVMISPFLFVGGLIEVYKSSMWTQAYRQLRELTTQKADQVTKPAVAT